MASKTRKSDFLRFTVVVIFVAAFAVGVNAEENPIVGTWELTSVWGKGEQKGKHIVSMNPDLTGTVKDLEVGWTSKLRNVKSEGGAVMRLAMAL